jgi:hypothetical protein
VAEVLAAWDATRPGNPRDLADVLQADTWARARADEALVARGTR